MQVVSYNLSVRVHGKTLKEFSHNGDIWIEGRKGSEFVIRVSNDSSRRILAVVSVDGRSVMDGKEATKNSGGYVIGAFSHVDIPGWRLDNEGVAKFRFHKASRSYAVKSGQSENIGVIGCAIHEEKEYFLRNDISDQNMARPIARAHSFRRAERCTDEPSLGTEFGSRKDHKVRTIKFEPSGEVTTMQLRYADRAELKRRGVDVDARPVEARKPDAFPGDRGCTPPDGWRG